MVPLCVECHSRVHDGLGNRRDNHNILTKQGLARKRPFYLYSLWWAFFKDEEESISLEDVADDFWTCTPFSLSMKDTESVILNRHKLTKDLLKELDMAYELEDNPMKEVFGDKHEHYKSYRDSEGFQPEAA